MLGVLAIVALAAGCGGDQRAAKPAAGQPPGAVIDTLPYDATQLEKVAPQLLNEEQVREPVPTDELLREADRANRYLSFCDAYPLWNKLEEPSPYDVTQQSLYGQRYYQALKSVDYAAEIVDRTHNGQGEQKKFPLPSDIITALKVAQREIFAYQQQAVFARQFFQERKINEAQALLLDRVAFFHLATGDFVRADAAINSFYQAACVGER